MKLKKSSSLKLLSQSKPNFAEKPSNDYFIKILFLLSKWFQTKRFLWEFPIGSYVKLSSAVAAILVGVLKCRTQFWTRLPTKMATKLKIEKRGDEIKKKSSLKLLSQSQPNFTEMILGWSYSKIVSGTSEHQPRWPPHRTQFWKGAIQGSFHKSLIAIGPVVSEEKIFM
jgi:hypothetical protein